MTLLDDIKAATRSVIAQGNLSEGWQYRTITSAPSASARTFSAWSATVFGLATGRRHSEEYDEQKQTMSRTELTSLRLSDAVVLKPGDQVRDTATSTVWSVQARETGAGGTWRFTLVRELPNKQTPARGGGV